MRSPASTWHGFVESTAPEPYRFHNGPGDADREAAPGERPALEQAIDAGGDRAVGPTSSGCR